MTSHPMAASQAAPTERRWRPPVGTIHVVDPSPLNWLFITWNTMEEPIRVDQEGRVVNALATSARWPDEHTLELELRTGVRFQDGEPFTAHNIKRNFDEMQRWAAPHPPGTWLNFPPESICEVVNEQHWSRQGVKGSSQATQGASEPSSKGLTGFSGASSGHAC